MSVYEISLLATGINLLINYCIGKPGSEFSPYEIFSGYTVWLSKRRLKILGLYNQYENQVRENFKTTNYRHERVSLINDFDKVIYSAAEPFFTWERAAGMCSICTGVWVSIITGLLFTFNFVALLTIVVTSHIATRILNKLL